VKPEPPHAVYGIPRRIFDENEGVRGCFRFRPEDVIAACILGEREAEDADFPRVPFSDADRLGKRVRDWLTEMTRLMKQRPRN
jgi:hypothetical protein